MREKERQRETERAGERDRERETERDTTRLTTTFQCTRKYGTDTENVYNAVAMCIRSHTVAIPASKVTQRLAYGPVARFTTSDLQGTRVGVKATGTVLQPTEHEALQTTWRSKGDDCVKNLNPSHRCVPQNIQLCHRTQPRHTAGVLIETVSTVTLIHWCFVLFKPVPPK